jgi:SAM-dependent methyltransferase
MFDRLRWWVRKRDPVVSEWEWYAREHLRAGRRHHLGDEWNTPEVVGLPIAATEIVDYIDGAVLEPYIGQVASLLEIGSGGGRFTAPLAERASQLIASDTSPSMLRLLRERFRDRPGISFLPLDGHDLRAIPDATLDAVFSYDVFVHLPAWHIYLYLEEIRRVLRPGARAVLHHANLTSELGWKRFLRDARRVRAGEAPQAQFSPMTPQLMRELAARAGLDVVATLTEVVPRDCITVLTRPA